MTKKIIKVNKYALEIIKESLSKAYKQVLLSMRDNLIDKVGLLKEEATYIVAFYGALKKANLLNSKYLKNFDYPGYSHEGQLPDISNIQWFMRKPELFYELVLNLLHNNELLSKFALRYEKYKPVDDDKLDIKLMTDSEREEYDEKIKEITSKDGEQEETVSAATTGNKRILDSNNIRYKELIVAEDANFITFMLTKYVPNFDKIFQNYWKEADPNTKNIYNDLWMGWCTLSGQSTFESTRQYPDNTWFVTLTKHHPLEIIKKLLIENNIIDKNKDYPHNVIIDLYQKHGYSDNYRDQFGEIYLYISEDRLNSKQSITSNAGFHSFTNSPYHGIDYSKLHLFKPSYTYEQIIKGKLGDISSAQIDISGTKLINARVNTKVFRIPQGVRSIEKEAIKGYALEELILPYTLQYIESDAFVNCNNLKIIRAYNSLDTISPDAFRQCELNQKITMGVFEKEGDEYIVKKPKNLRYFPREYFNVPAAPAKAVSNINKLAEDKQVGYNIKKSLVYEDDDIVIANSKLYFKKTFDKNIINIKEGTVELGSDTMPDKLVTMVFPQSFSKLSMYQFNKSHIKNMYMKDSNITEIPEGCFKMSALTEIELPKRLQRILNEAFASCLRLIDIVIPENVSLINNTAFKNTILDEIYTKDKNKLKLLLDKNPELLDFIVQDNNAY